MLTATKSSLALSLSLARSLSLSLILSLSLTSSAQVDAGAELWKYVGHGQTRKVTVVRTDCVECERLPLTNRDCSEQPQANTQKTHRARQTAAPTDPEQGYALLSSPAADGVWAM